MQAIQKKKKKVSLALTPNSNMIKLNRATTLILVLAILVSLQVGLSSSSVNNHVKEDDDVYTESNYYYSPLGKEEGRMRCNKYPRICHVRGSPGPDCCNKKCVNVKRDNLNCGMCGYKCGHQETCCNGKCVNPLRDRKHCGGCGNKCIKGDVCHYGMCSYA